MTVEYDITAAADEAAEARLVVTRRRPVTRAGVDYEVVEFTVWRHTGRLDENGQPILEALVSGANEWRANTTAAQKRAHLLAWAREIAPDGVTL